MESDMCPDCEARRQLAREAWLNARIGDAVKQVATGAAEAVGIKEKTGSKDLRAKFWPGKSSTKRSGAAG